MKPPEFNILETDTIQTSSVTEEALRMIDDVIRRFLRETTGYNYIKNVPYWIDREIQRSLFKNKRGFSNSLFRVVVKGHFMHRYPNRYNRYEVCAWAYMIKKRGAFFRGKVFCLIQDTRLYPVETVRIVYDFKGTSPF